MKDFFNPTLPEGQEGVVGDKSRLLAGLLGFFFGTWGVHMFILGYTKKGVIFLVAYLLVVVANLVLVGIFFAGILFSEAGGGDGFFVFPIVAWLGLILLSIPSAVFSICALISSICILANSRYIDADGKLLK